MEAAHHYDEDEAKEHLALILEQVATGVEVVISQAGEPVAKVVPVGRKVQRTGRGSLRGALRIANDFDELPDCVASAFGMR